MTEIEYLESKIREERTEVSKLREKERLSECAEGLHRLYQSLVDAGFSEEQAWELFLKVYEKNAV